MKLYKENTVTQKTYLKETLPEATLNKRPKVVTDLSEYKREGQSIVTKPNKMTPELARWYGNIIATAHKAGLVVTDSMDIVRPLSSVELNNRLKNLQNDYDQGHKDYVHLLNERESPKYQWDMNLYLKTEGLSVTKEDIDLYLTEEEEES